eukprot:gene19858-26553_t
MQYATRNSGAAGSSMRAPLPDFPKQQERISSSAYRSTSTPRPSSHRIIQGGSSTSLSSKYVNNPGGQQPSNYRSPSVMPPSGRGSILDGKQAGGSGRLVGSASPVPGRSPPNSARHITSQPLNRPGIPTLSGGSYTSTYHPMKAAPPTGYAHPTAGASAGAPPRPPPLSSSFKAGGYLTADPICLTDLPTPRTTTLSSQGSGRLRLPTSSRAPPEQDHLSPSTLTSQFSAHRLASPRGGAQPPTGPPFSASRDNSRERSRENSRELPHPPAISTSIPHGSHSPLTSPTQYTQSLSHERRTLLSPRSRKINSTELPSSSHGSSLRPGLSAHPTASSSAVAGAASGHTLASHSSHASAGVGAHATAASASAHGSSSHSSLMQYSSSNTSSSQGSAFNSQTSVDNSHAHSLAHAHAHISTAPPASYTSDKHSILNCHLPTLSSVLGPAPSSGQGCVGLQNLGNTCYMNSILQSLNAVPELVSWFCNAASSSQNKWTSKAVVAPSYAELISLMWLKPGERGVVSPSAFMRKVAKIDSRWGDGSQQDSQEFLHSLLGALQTETNRVVGKPKYRELDLKGPEEEQAMEAETYARLWNDSVVDDIFGGLLQSSLVCQHCKRESHCFDPFVDLCVPIPNSKSGVSLQDCLRSFVETEKLDGSESYKCEQCKTQQPHTKRLQIYKYPRVLVLTLKRFSSRSSNSLFSRFRSASKNNTAVALDAEYLDITPFCNPSALKQQAGQGRTPLQPVYQLISISHHSGSLEGGHYTASAKSPVDDQWRYFNDTSVRKDNTPTNPSASAYVLFYRLVQLH